MIPLIKFISAIEIDKVFINIPVSKADHNVSFLKKTMSNIPPYIYMCVFASQDLVKVHKSLMAEIQDSVQNKNAENLHQIFITYKDKYKTSMFKHNTLFIHKTSIKQDKVEETRQNYLR